MTLIETVWHLCEILFIETLPGTISIVKCYIVVNDMYSACATCIHRLYTLGVALIFQDPRSKSSQ